MTSSISKQNIHLQKLKLGSETRIE